MYLPLIQSFTNSHRIPRNRNRIIDMKQSVTVSGLGLEEFDGAVRAVKAIHQRFAAHVGGLGGTLRDWSPQRDGEHLTLMFSNRYLTEAKYAAGETPMDLGEFVDPLQVLRPMLVNRSEVHIQDNVVEYWERTEGSSSSR